MLYFGTTNAGKLSEVAALLNPLRIDVHPVSADIPEPYDTFRENAILKAGTYAKMTGRVALAEDSGIVVPALSGTGGMPLPGPWSARFWRHPLVGELHSAKFPGLVSAPHRDRMAGPPDAEGMSPALIDWLNNHRLLDFMRGMDRREAYMQVEMVMCAPTGEILFSATGISHGSISEEPRGSHGFGYDPIFIGDDTARLTYSELDPARKNMRSHRGKVLEDLLLWCSQHREVLA